MRRPRDSLVQASVQESGDLVLLDPKFWSLAVRPEILQPHGSNSDPWGRDDRRLGFVGRLNRYLKVYDGKAVITGGWVGYPYYSLRGEVAMPADGG